MIATAKVRYFCRTAVEGLRRSPFVHGVAVAAIGISLLAVGLARGTSRLLDGAVSAVGSDVQLTVYLEGDRDRKDAEVIGQTLLERLGGAPTLVSPEAALSRLRVELGEMGDALDGVPYNPLPWSVELILPQSAREPESLAVVAAELERSPGVSAVDYGKEAVERLAAAARAVRVGGLIAFIVVMLATVVIVSATLQLAIYSRREEIEIQKLVGATNRFVKTPFLLEGLFQGLFGAALACMALWLVSLAALPYLTSLFTFLRMGSASTALFSPRGCFELAVLGAALGLCGSFVAVGRFLRV